MRAVEGEIWDVAVDIRRGSPTFGRWVGFELSADGCQRLCLPPGLAHGFRVLSESAQVEYKCSRFYDPGDELGIAWNDPRLAIEWPVDDPVLSVKDAAAPTLEEVEELLPVFYLWIECADRDPKSRRAEEVVSDPRESRS